MSEFKFSQRSLRRFKGVNPDLVKVIKLALKKSPVDITVVSGVRTAEEQNKLFKDGKSQKDGFRHKSRHQFGEAIDIVPFVDGKISWKWAHIFKMADAVKAAADELGVRIRWGGSWTELSDQPLSAKALSDAYVESRKSVGAKPFLDGAHFETIL